ncbi:MAG TPA: c-type cytochrome [Gammaproteobacteria bacterium]
MAIRTLLLGVLLLAATSLCAAPDGAQLYGQHCAVCHGSQGRGGVGVPIALPAFLATVDDEFLFKTIRTGRPGRVMPAFTDLSDAQVSALVKHLRSWAPSQQVISHSDRRVKGNVSRGKELYGKHCAGCHGAKGEGGHGTGVTFSRPRELPVMPPALNNKGFLTAASDSMIKQTLMKGREGTPMMSYLAMGLKERDINDIVAYVRSFETAPLLWRPPEDEAPVLEMASPYSVEETVENLKRAIVGKNFVVIRIQTLDNGFVPEAKEDHHQVIVYFCNFNFINQALSLDPRIGLFMPCRITVVEQDGVVKVMSINPKYQSRLFNNEELDVPCEEMTDVYKGIIEEATI